MRRLGAKRIKAEEQMRIGTEYFKSHFNVRVLSDEERTKITRGYTAEDAVAICTFYIPGETPRDAKVLAEIRIDRYTGEILGYNDHTWII
jgi:hypothetical protein